MVIRKDPLVIQHSGLENGPVEIVDIPIFPLDMVI